MVKLYEETVHNEEQLMKEKFAEILNHINAIIMLMNEYPECSDIVLRMNECKKRIRCIGNRINK
ncbi:MAG: hypothetical protein IJA72_02075 [Clostridia bacterium]|nr:hypothetical protein [Clostridia bacterium]